MIIERHLFLGLFSPLLSFQMARVLGHFGIVTSTMWIPLYIFVFYEICNRWIFLQFGIVCIYYCYYV